MKNFKQLVIDIEDKYSSNFTEKDLSELAHRILNENENKYLVYLEGRISVEIKKNIGIDDDICIDLIDDPLHKMIRVDIFNILNSNFDSSKEEIFELILDGLETSLKKYGYVIVPGIQNRRIVLKRKSLAKKIDDVTSVGLTTVLSYVIFYIIFKYEHINIFTLQLAAWIKILILIPIFFSFPYSLKTIINLIETRKTKEFIKQFIVIVVSASIMAAFLLMILL